MRNDVVQLTSDPKPFLGDPALRLLLPPLPDGGTLAGHRVAQAECGRYRGGPEERTIERQTARAE